MVSGTIVKTVKKLPEDYFLVFGEYGKRSVNDFLNKKFFFNDKLLKNYFETGDIKKFRNRVSRVHSDKSFDDVVKVLVTESIRPILYSIIDELTKFLEPMGDMIISGGEAHNHYVKLEDRVVTSDIDTKFVPKMKPDEKYFGKLQAIKLLLWNKLGEIAKRDNLKIIKSVLKELTKRNLNNEYLRVDKIRRFIGLTQSSTSKGYHVARRYTLMPKRKNIKNKPDTLIDVELFTLDLKLKYYDIKSAKLKDGNFGGILDIAFMRPNQLGYSIAKRDYRVKGFDVVSMYYNKKKLIQRYENIKLPTREYLLEDIYIMSKIGLRPDKKEKDRKRMLLLAKQISKKKIESRDSMDTIAKKAGINIKKTSHSFRKHTRIGPKIIKNASNVNPKKYINYTTKPDKKKLSSQIVYGIKSSDNTFKTPPRYIRTQSDYIFNQNNMKCKLNTNNDFIKNEMNFRPIKPKPFNNNNLKMEETLYGFKPKRDQWVPKPLLRKSAMIPFIGLKN